MKHEEVWTGCYSGTFDLISPESFAHPINTCNYTDGCANIYTWIRSFKFNSHRAQNADSLCSLVLKHAHFVLVKGVGIVRFVNMLPKYAKCASQNFRYRFGGNVKIVARFARKFARINSSLLLRVRHLFVGVVERRGQGVGSDGKLPDNGHWLGQTITVKNAAVMDH